MARKDLSFARERLPLDDLVNRLREPDFASRHRRRLSLRHTSRHVNPLMLAVADPGSQYVSEWRAHAGNCAACHRVFCYFGLD